MGRVRQCPYKTSFLCHTGCPRTRGSNLECVFLDGNEGKKRLEKYS
jgi:hypothetical protein